MGYELFSIENSVICVTGGSGGIGSGLAAGLAELGARVVILGQNMQKLKAAAEKIGVETGKHVDCVRADITDEGEVEAAFQEINSRFGRLDGLVNCAGTSYVAPLCDMPIDRWQHVMDVNVRGTVLCCRAAGKYMHRSGGGHIVNISSLAATHGKPGYTAYTPSKAAVNALTFTLAAEWGRLGINVNSVSPTIVVTEINRKQIADNPGYLNKVLSTIPNGRACSAQELLGTVAFLLSPASSYLTGQNIGCDGGAQNGDIAVIPPLKEM